MPFTTASRRALWAVAGILAIGCTPAGDSPLAPKFETDAPTMAAFAGPKVVISQVYGAGGNTGALYRNDYVELFNAGSETATLDGMSLQYASATGTGLFGVTGQNVTLAGTVNPGSYYLVQLSGGSVGAVLPTPDRTGVTNAAAGAGKFALVTGTTSLGCNGAGTLVCSDAQKARIVDLVGFGSANYFEGTGAAPTASATLAVFRKSGGAQDTDNNAADFVAAAPAPRNSATVVVVVGPLDAVTLPSALAVEKDVTTTLSATAKDAANLAITAGTVAWSTTNANVTVTSTGPRTASVRGNVIGSAVVTATLTVDGITRSATSSVTITPKAAAGAPSTVDVTNYPPTPLPIGFEFQVFATIKDGFGATLTGIDRNWLSNNPAVATVDQATGVIRAVGLGRAYIVAFPAEGVRDSIYVDVADVKEATTANYANHLEFGRPVDATPDDEYLVQWNQFAASWNRTRGQSNWVAYNLEQTHRGPAERCNCFTPDPTLPADFPKVVYTDYTGSGYSRGHMTMSEDRTAGGSATTTSLDNARTFYMTNIIPQTSENNGGPWLALETYLGGLAVGGTKEIFIIAGGAQYVGTLSNQGKVSIPTRTWKIAVILPRNQGLANVTSTTSAEIIAVDMPNTTSMPSGNDWRNYVVSVDSVEKLTGYDLLSLLPNPLEEIVESGDRAPSARIVANGGTEGQVLTFDGSTSSDPDIGGPLQDALAYTWIVNGRVTSNSATVTGSFPDNGNVSVSLIVTDRFGWADTTSTTVAITNAAPSVAAIDSRTILAGETYTAASSFTDAGTADTWTASVNFGDGSGPQALTLDGSDFTLSHRYATAGVFTVTVAVTDDDGGTGTRSTTVTVHSAAQGVQNLSDLADALSGVLNNGELQSLQAKLNVAAASLRRGNVEAASGQLGAFINEIEAMSGDRIPAATAESIIAYARRVLASIGG